LEKEKVENQSEKTENFEVASGDRSNRFRAEENRVELEFQKLQKKKDFRRKGLKIAGIMLVLLATFGALIIVFFKNKNSQEKNMQAEQAQIEIPENQDHAFLNDPKVTTPAIEKESQNSPAISENINISGEEKGLDGKSENYQIREIAIGTGNIVLEAVSENLPLEVSDVHSEMLMSKDGKKTQLLLSWKTNKLAKSEVKYSKDGNGSERSIKEDGYGFSHALILNSLEQSARYLFSVKVVDRSGNISSSNVLAVFTGAKPVSVFELIAAQFGDIFGWAMKK